MQRNTEDLERLIVNLKRKNDDLQNTINEMKKAEVDVNHMQAEVHAAQRLLFAVIGMQPDKIVRIPNANMKDSEDGAMLSSAYDGDAGETIICCVVG